MENARYHAQLLAQVQLKNELEMARQAMGGDASEGGDSQGGDGSGPEMSRQPTDIPKRTG